jgi:rhamnogalacturonan endolyase
MDFPPESHPRRPAPWRRTITPFSKAIIQLSLLSAFLSAGAVLLKANVPGGIVPNSPAVTLTDGGGSVTLSNGIVAIVCNKSNSEITQINYTYNNGAGSKTVHMLSGGNNGGMLYWEYGNFDGTTGDASNAAYSVVVNPATGDANHAPGDYAEIDLLNSSSTTGSVDVHFSMLRGSPGFYVAATWAHPMGQPALTMGETRTNIYNGTIFNWMSVDSARNRLMEIPNGTAAAVPGAPQECSIWTSGIYNGQYEDKYKNSAIFDNNRVWGFSSVGSNGANNFGLWNVSASMEYYNGGPLKRELMTQQIPDILNMFNGGHYWADVDLSFTTTEKSWAKTLGPYFVYCNNVPSSQSDMVTASQALYNDALSQQGAEATAWPYNWFVNSNYVPTSGRGTVSGQIVISDSGNPSASAAKLLVNLVQQPPTSNASYDFQEWMKPYQFWTTTDSNGNFTVPNVIAGTGYTLYAFGPGAEGTFMSQHQTGGDPTLLFNVPTVPFGVTVTGGSTTNLGVVTWTPTRVGPTVFEIGYPDRTARKFRHGDDWWVGGIGPSASAPDPIWTKFLEYPFDFPNGMTYNVGSSRWSTDWDFVQPVVVNSAGSYVSSTGTIRFTLPSAPASGVNASLYIALTSAYDGPTLIKVNGTNLGSTSGVTATPKAISSTGFTPTYNNNDTTVREGINSMFCDERINFPASLLKSGTNINTITITNNQGGYFADHIMYDYLRLELPGYVPPAPASVSAYAGNSSMLLSWPVMPGATSYNISRSITSNSSFSTIATGVTGPVCGSGPNNATWLDTTATNGTAYYYEVQSVNVAGASANSPQSTGTAASLSAPSSPPAAPTGVTATAGNAQASLSWNAATGANYYTVQRSTLYANTNTGGTYNNLRTITLTNTVSTLSYVDTSVNNGTIYGYTVTAGNAAGSGAASAQSIVTPVAPVPTAAPVVTVTPGTGQVTLKWAAIPGAVGYVIEMATASGGPYTLVGSVTELTYVVTGLSNGVTYYFTVQASNSGGTSASSNTANATTTLPPPTSLTATPGNTQVFLSWPVVTSATGYSVRRSATTGGPYTAIASTAGPSYTDTGRTNGTAYYYVVASSNATGTGTNSAEASATPTSSVPIAPTNLVATAGSGQVVLTWNTSVGATSYVVAAATTNGGPYSVLNSLVSGTTFTAAGLQGGTTYYYVVAATGTGGTGAYSLQASATPTAGLGLIWNGNISTAWNTSAANWQQAGATATYSDGANVVFSDTATTSTVVLAASFNPGSVTFNNSVLNYNISGGAIAGSTGLTMSGSANVTLGSPNTFTGQTVINSGTLTLADPLALQGSTLNYGSQSGSLNFGGLTSASIGGLMGNGTLTLDNNVSTAVALTVLGSTQAPVFSGVLTGDGSVAFAAGTATLAGANTYTGTTTLTTGTLNITSSGAIGSFDTSAGTFTVASTVNTTPVLLNVNGGAIFTASLTQNNQGSGGTPTEVLLTGGGSITVDGLFSAEADNGNSNGLVEITNGTLTANAMTIGRDTNLGATAPTAAISQGTSTGVYINGGALNINTSLEFSNGAGTNSSSTLRMDSGFVTVGGVTIVASNAAGRYNCLDINGGTFTDNDTSGVGIQIGGQYADPTQDSELLITSGTLNTPVITLSDSAQTGGSDNFYAFGGVTYIGSGGIVAGGATGTAFVINLGNGASTAPTIAASASWSSFLPMALNSSSSAPVTFQTADSSDTPFDITLGGALSGAGGLTKTGGGTLTLSANNTYTGATVDGAGVLKVTGDISNTSSVTIASGATFYLAGGSLLVGGNITNNGLFKISGLPTLSSGSFINNGVLDLINGPSSLPANFVNNGSILNSGSVTVQQATISGNTFSLTIQSYVQHNYQLQRTASLANPGWVNVGSLQAGTGSVLNFADPSATAAQGFYRVLVSP